MNPNLHFNALVNATMAQMQRPDRSEASRLVEQLNPDASILASAYGASGQQVSFYNSRVTKLETAPAVAQARQSLKEKVQAEMGRGLSYDNAWNRVQRQNPELMRTISFANGGDVFGGKPESKPASFINDAATGIPVRSPQVTKMFRMPIDTTQSEWEAAWRGNGNAIAPINPGKIFAALVELAQKEKGVSYDSALQLAKGRFPELWAECEAIAGNPKKLI